VTNRYACDEHHQIELQITTVFKLMRSVILGESYLLLLPFILKRDGSHKKEKMFSFYLHPVNEDPSFKLCSTE